MMGRDNALVAFFEFGVLLSPDLIAGFHVERDDMRVQRLPKEFSLIDRRRAAHDRAGARNPQRKTIVIHGRAPDLPAGRDIDRERPVAVHHVHHTVVNRRLRQLAHVVGETEVPQTGTSRLTFDLLICLSGLYIFRS